MGRSKRAVGGRETDSTHAKADRAESFGDTDSLVEINLAANLVSLFGALWLSWTGPVVVVVVSCGGFVYTAFVGKTLL